MRTRRDVPLPAVPPRVVADRRSTLRRVLLDLPDPLLAALISGLELHGDDLRYGTLFPSHSSSCAAGAMVRQLYPDDFQCGRVRFLIRHRWRRRAASYGGQLAACSHVAHIEAIFDRGTMLTLILARGVTERQAARAVGRWIRAEAERELGRRTDLRARGADPGDYLGSRELAWNGLDENGEREVLCGAPAEVWREREQAGIAGR